VGGHVLIDWGTHHCANQIWNCSTAVKQMMEVNFLGTVEGHGKNVGKGFWGGKTRCLEVSQNLVSAVCLNETYSRVRVGKNLLDMFPVMSGLKLMLYFHCFSTLL